MFAIIYAKIIDGKKSGLELEGPYMGPQKDNLEEAHSSSKDLVSSCKDLMLIKIYDLSTISHSDALEKARTSFNNTFMDMQSAADILDRPVIKRKKRLRIKETDLDLL
jgi:hypothetical protein